MYWCSEISSGNDVVTVFLYHEKKILLLKRSNNVKTMKNKWAGISGFIENEDPLSCAYREIFEETGIKKKFLTPLQQGETLPLFLSDNHIKLIIHPFLFLSMTNIVKLNWENSEYRWIRPQDIDFFDCVPKLKNVLTSVYHNF